MKILELGNFYFSGSFREMGHDVKRAATDQGADVILAPFIQEAKQVLAALPAGWVPDLIVLGDNSTQPIILGLETIDIPLVWYAIDSHIHAGWHRYYSAVFDVVCVAQKGWTPLYEFDLARQIVSWQPLFCQATEDRDLGMARTTPLVFVGTLNPVWNPDRVDLIRRLQARYAIDVRTGAYVEIFNQAQMVLNQSVANDVNFRTFQAMACGAMLVTERVENGFDDLFQDRVHCVVYEKGNVEQIVALAEYYGPRASEREAIARRGREAVMGAHTARHRAEAILAMLAGADLQRMVRERLAGAASIQLCLARVYDVAMQKYLNRAQKEQDGAKKWFYRRMAEQYAENGLAICRALGPVVHVELSSTR